MKDKLIAELIEKVGTLDADVLVEKLESFGVEDFEIVDRGISIPIKSINNLEAFRNSLHGASKVERLFEVTQDGKNILVDTFNMLNQEEKYPFGNKNSFFWSAVFEGECEHFKYGKNWVANRNILFRPDGKSVVLNDPNHPNNTIHVADVKEYLDLGINYRQVGDLRFTENDGSLTIEYKLDDEDKYLENSLKLIVEDRARKEILEVLDKGYAEKISKDDFYHGHPVIDPSSPKEIYILYHTYENCKPSLEKQYIKSQMWKSTKEGKNAPSWQCKII